METNELNTVADNSFKAKHLAGNYYVGMNLGTNSLGYAVTNAWYDVLKCRGKSLWGVRLFNEANTAQDRRMHRAARRNLHHRNWRLSILEEIFAEEIAAVDPGYYLRMKESKYYPEDKRDMDGKCPDLPYTLFADKDYTDKDYHNDFPTIYHLRKYLMTTNDNPDIRLVYNAIHHFMKHRGHFVLSGNVDQVTDFFETFNQFIANIHNEELDFTLDFDQKDLEFIRDTLKDNKLTKGKKKSALVKHFNAKTACEKEIFSLITGGTAKLSKIFGNEEFDNGEKSAISFEGSSYEEDALIVEGMLGEQFYIIESAKAVYDWLLLTDILNGYKTLSDAKIAVYEQHKSDLEFLKRVVRKYLTPEDYKRVFRISQKGLYNYCAYVGSATKNNKKVATYGSRGNVVDFTRFLKSEVLQKMPDGKDKEILEERLELGNFLPIQSNKSNSVIPYQIHLQELVKILDNVGAKNPFIKENSDHIMQLFTFRVPYYVGPTHVQGDPEKDKFSWAVRKNNDKIYPWNFNDVIDVESSAEAFIRRMTNKCGYIYTEDVIPKNSLLYAKYMVLNEINCMQIDGQNISVPLKQQIYNELFCTYRNVTKSKLRTFLIEKGYPRNISITGISDDFKLSLKAYHDFKDNLPEAKLSDDDKEAIILNVSLFGDDKNLLKQRLARLFPSLSEKQIKTICTFSYSGWGRFSRKFLEGVKTPTSIIDAMWDTNNNLMQLMGKNFQFAEAVEKYNNKEKEDVFSYEVVQNTYASPSVKCQVWNALRTLMELKEITGKDPERIFIDIARGGEGQKDGTRKKQLLKLYKTCQKKESAERMKELMDQLEKCDDAKLRNTSVYLYFTQLGRCMYSGHVIDYNQLLNSNKYNKDHIFPRSKTMDDSLDNLVLSEKMINKDKDNIYPIFDAISISEEQIAFWKKLKEYGLISKNKYERLIRKTPLTSEELSDFVSRQLVETRQSTKLLAGILKRLMPNTEIVYVKSKLITEFRQRYDFLKLRDMNDLHNAKDAYLNVVVGNGYYTKFVKNTFDFAKSGNAKYSIVKLFDHDICVNKTGEIVWMAGDGGTLSNVRRYMNKNDIMVARQTYEVKHGQNGGLFDQNPVKKGNGQLPLKSSDDRLCDISKYGGYNMMTGTYYMLVESIGKKGEKVRSIEFVPLYLKKKIEESDENAISYLEESRGLVDPKILIHKIKKNTLFKINGSHVRLTGRSNNSLIFNNADQLLLDDIDQNTLKKVLKFCTRNTEFKASHKNQELTITDKDNITEDELIRLYDIFTDKLVNQVYAVNLSYYGNILTKEKDKFLGLSAENKCVVLAEILHMFQCCATKADLSLLGGSKNSGRISIGCAISNSKSIKSISIVNQSVTGFYENEVNLLA